MQDLEKWSALYAHNFSGPSIAGLFWSSFLNSNRGLFLQMFFLYPISSLALKSLIRVVIFMQFLFVCQDIWSATEACVLHILLINEWQHKRLWNCCVADTFRHIPLRQPPWCNLAWCNLGDDGSKSCYGGQTVNPDCPFFYLKMFTNLWNSILKLWRKCGFVKQTIARCSTITLVTL